MAGTAKSPETRTLTERPRCGECTYMHEIGNGKGSSPLDTGLVMCIGFSALSVQCLLYNIADSKVD